MELISKIRIGNSFYPIYPMGDSYSTEEQDTGLKWIDGKNIYRKASILTTPQSDNVTVGSGVDTFINAFGNIVKENEKYVIPCKTTDMFFSWYKTTNNSIVFSHNIKGSFIYQATVLYTKV